MSSKKNENVDADLIRRIDKMRIENQGSNFVPTLLKHLANLKRFASFKQLGASVFPDRQTYQSFAASCLFYKKLEYFHKEKLFRIYDPAVEEDFYKDYNMPAVDAFHYTDDEKEMYMNRASESVKKGDILHLKVVDEEADKYLLQILNKYRDEERLVDCSLFAVLIKDTPMVKEIYPPLKKSNLLRAVVLGKVKEENVMKKVVMSINPIFINDLDLKTHLKMGRVYKKDIPFYPVDMSDFSSFREFLDANSTFESTKRNFQHTSAFQCNPLKTGPMFETYYKKQLSVDSSSSEAVEKFHVAHEKFEKAKKILNKGDITNALLEIEEVLKAFPENDMVLTTRGKIYLAMAGGKPSSKVKKAMMDFVAALKINCFNEEAAAFRDSIIMVSIRRFTENNLLDKAAELQSSLKTSNDVIASAEAFLKNIKHENEVMQTASNVAETGAADAITTPVVKDEPEPMDLN